MQATLVFPNQLFEKHPCLKKDVFLIEDKRFFTDFRFHKKKLVLHRASMQAYKDFLKNKGHRVHYIEFNRDWERLAKKYQLFTVKPYDRVLEKRLSGAEYCMNPGFLGGELNKSKKYFMASFYKKQRKRLDVLMENSKPVGGKFSFDEENRKRLPKKHKPPKINASTNEYIEKAADYVNKNFPDNPGDTSGFFYPVTFRDAKDWLRHFIDERLNLFGDYEDAISEDEEFIYHSILSPLLNTGLLTPDYVLQKVLDSGAAINSREGFIRQIIGWREFILQVYLLQGETQRKSNFFNNKKKLPKSFYTATTNIGPVDNVLNKVLKNAYAHHIERLMVLGNFMLLNGYHPKEIYRWFMEMFIDAYDWVMVPNVFGMSQFADAGLMSTKPYISSSNYILKMSDFKKGDWCSKWDNLFWYFLKKHKDKLKSIPRMRALLKKIH